MNRPCMDKIGALSPAQLDAVKRLGIGAAGGAALGGAGLGLYRLLAPSDPEETVKHRRRAAAAQALLGAMLGAGAGAGGAWLLGGAGQSAARAKDQAQGIPDQPAEPPLTATDVVKAQAAAHPFTAAGVVRSAWNNYRGRGFTGDPASVSLWQRIRHPGGSGLADEGNLSAAALAKGEGTVGELNRLRETHLTVPVDKINKKLEAALQQPALQRGGINPDQLKAIAERERVAVENAFRKKISPVLRKTTRGQAVRGTLGPILLGALLDAATQRRINEVLSNDDVRASGAATADALKETVNAAVRAGGAGR